ncbi:MAG: YqeG family HAD IIIA-type phosphatase [Lachnospiraceae bacterium]|jgi:HAD superfamily phosphatase (TIGR01668 family)|nr:YqeG family HAD IIIA-type phosphatase [Lachnospiraceae bacterium]
MMAESAAQVPFRELAKRGVRGVIFDIDNTLVPHGFAADEAAVALAHEIKSLGVGVCLLSNNSEKRVAPFADALGAYFIAKAGKPGVGGYREACLLLGTTAQTTVFVGDQLFTDIWGAKRAGMYSILVKPIHPKEEIQIRLKRILERPILWWWGKHGAVGCAADGLTK